MNACYAILLRGEAMARTAAARIPITSIHKKSIIRDQRTEDSLKIAAQQGLLEGGRTRTIRGRMPSGLVEQAKKKI